MKKVSLPTNQNKARQSQGGEIKYHDLEVGFFDRAARRKRMAEEAELEGKDKRNKREIDDQ